MTFNINWGKKGVYITFRGVVSAQDLIDANNYIISNVNFETIDYQVFDFLHVDDFKITSYDISIIATINESQIVYNKNMKIAIVAQNEFAERIAAEYKQFMANSDWESRSFENLEIAKEWAKSK